MDSKREQSLEPKQDIACRILKWFVCMLLLILLPGGMLFAVLLLVRRLRQRKSAVGLGQVRWLLRDGPCADDD